MIESRNFIKEVLKGKTLLEFLVGNFTKVVLKLWVKIFHKIFLNKIPLKVMKKKFL